VQGRWTQINPTGGYDIEFKPKRAFNTAGLPALRKTFAWRGSGIHPDRAHPRQFNHWHRSSDEGGRRLRCGKSSRPGVYRISPTKLTLAMGRDLQPAVTDLALCRTLLIAGSTGHGKERVHPTAHDVDLYKASPTK